LASIASAAVVILFWAPIVWLLFVIFGPAASAGGGAVVALSASLLAPATEMLLAPARRALAAVPWGAALLFYFVASTLSPFNEAAPRPDTLFFAIDADRRTALWASPDPAPDAWTSRVLDGKTRDPLEPFFPGGSGWRFMTHEVPAPEVSTAQLRLVHEDRTPTGRDLELWVTPTPGTELLTVYVGPEAKVTSGLADGEAIPVGEHGAWSFVYSAPPVDGFPLRFHTGAEGPMTLRWVSQRGGWPEGVQGPGPRPPGLMAKSGVLPPYGELAESDMTLVTRSLTIR
jgi:hypothetical protein